MKIFDKIAKIPSFFRWLWIDVRKRAWGKVKSKVVGEVKETIDEII